MSRQDDNTARDSAPAPAHVHEGGAPREGSPAWWWQTIKAREADLERARADEQKAREASGEALLHHGVPDARLLGEVAKAQALVASLEDAVRQGMQKLAQSEKAEKHRQAEALQVKGEEYGREYLEASKQLEDAIEQMAAHYIETARAGINLVRTISAAKQLVPPQGRVIAGDAREALAVPQYLSERVQTEITRRVGRELWPKAPDVPPGVANCPLSDQHGGIVTNALVELAATLNIEPEEA